MIDLLKILRFTPKDLQSVFADMVNIVASSSAAAVGVTADNFYTVPLDRLLWIQSCVIIGSPGGTQTMNQARLMALYHNRLLQLFGTRSMNDHPGYPSCHQNPVEMIVPPGAVLTAGAYFSAGAVSNNMSVCLIGFSIPRGSLSVT